MIRPEILSALAARAVGSGVGLRACPNLMPCVSAQAQRAGSEACATTRRYFRTDYAPYFADAQQTIAEHGAWTIAPAGTPWPFESQTVFQSRAEGFQSLIASSNAGNKRKK
jgi:hypothetical protein